MKSLKTALWIAAIGCLTAVPFIVLPWSVVGKIALWFGADPIAHDPLVMYIFRVSCGVYGLIGVYFILLARNPLGCGPMLELGACGLILFGLLSLITGLGLKLPLGVFAGDALSGLILGVVVLVLLFKKRGTLTS